jgi:hemoglobin
MAKVHAGMNLQPEHYDTVVRHLAAALSEFNVSDEDIHAVAAQLDNLREDILYK